jgi:tRNA(adenine34) deaminase
MAMLEADQRIGLARSPQPLTLVVNLEPCLMCMGAAMTLGIEGVWFGLESPNDGAVALLDQWRPPVEQPFFHRPGEIVGGIHRPAIRDQFARYATSAGPAGIREWARGPSLSQSTQMPRTGFRSHDTETVVPSGDLTAKRS